MLGIGTNKISKQTRPRRSGRLHFNGRFISLGKLHIILAAKDFHVASMKRHFGLSSAGVSFIRNFCSSRSSCYFHQIRRKFAPGSLRGRP